MVIVVARGIYIHMYVSLAQPSAAPEVVISLCRFRQGRKLKILINIVELLSNRIDMAA